MQKKGEKWETSIVREVMNIKNSLRKPISESERMKIKGNFPYYGPTKIQDYINEYNLDGKYVLIGEDGDHFLKYKNQSMTLLVDGKFNVNNHAHILQGTKKCTTEWFYYYFQHKNIFNVLTRQGAGRYKLTKSALEKMTITYPTIEEQEKIVEILTTWDLAIEKQEQLIEKKKEFKKGLMQRVLSGEVRLSGFNDKWKQMKLGSTIEVIKKEALPNPQDYNLLTVKLHVKGIEVTDKKPNATEKGRPYYLRIPGEILIGRQNFHNGGIGIVPSEMKGYIASNAITSLQVIRGDLLFYFYYLSNPSFYKRVDNIIGGTGQKEISEKTLKNLNVNVPVSIDEQKQIGLLFNDIDKEIELLEKELEALKLQKKGLMQRLLTGEVRVKV